MKGRSMELVQGRIVTDEVATLASFYAELVGASVVVNDYYVEVPTRSLSIGFSRCRYTEEQATAAGRCASAGAQRGELILDFVVDDVDRAYRRFGSLGVDWVMTPTTQPWGKRSMLFRDPEGHLVNVFSRNTVSHKEEA
jgi:uncharacterized glyoxalase superfamily protein PhnB